MKSIEIDGMTVEVHGCHDCPFLDHGDMGYQAGCMHPECSTQEEFMPGCFIRTSKRFEEGKWPSGKFQPFNSICPLKEVGGGPVTLRNCDTCGKLVHDIVKVDFGYGGIDDYDCSEWDRMTDEEAEMSNEGRCPYWEEAE